MPIKTNAQAEAYVYRMWNDDEWGKEYQVNACDLKKIKANDQDMYVLPILMTIERLYVDDDASAEYPNGIPDELDEDDKGLITLKFSMSFKNLFGEYHADESAFEQLIIDIQDKEYGTMDGGIVLSQGSTEHIYDCIGKAYVIDDLFNDKKNIYAELIEKAKTLN
jgi:hypothetical protein